MAGVAFSRSEHGKRVAGVELLYEQFAVTSRHCGRDSASCTSRRSQRASEDMPASLAPQPIARPCAAAMATRIP